MADEVLTKFKQQISGMTLVPAAGGKFEVSLDGNLIYSKLKEGRFPEPQEIIDAIEAQLAKVA